MEYVVGLIVMLVGGLLYTMSLLRQKTIESSLAENKGRDKELVDQQLKVENSISKIDKQIEEIKKQKEEIKAELTDQERAEKWK
jgi:phage shock protein A